MAGGHLTNGRTPHTPPFSKTSIATFRFCCSQFSPLVTCEVAGRQVGESSPSLSLSLPGCSSVHSVTCCLSSAMDPSFIILGRWTFFYLVEVVVEVVQFDAHAHTPESGRNLKESGRDENPCSLHLLLHHTHLRNTHDFMNQVLSRKRL